MDCIKTAFSESRGTESKAQHKEVQRITKITLESVMAEFQIETPESVKVLVQHHPDASGCAVVQPIAVARDNHPEA